MSKEKNVSPNIDKFSYKSGKESTIADTDKFRQKNEQEVHAMKDKIAREVPLDKYMEWYTDMYVKQIPDVTSIAPVDYSKGAVRRLANISSLKYLVHFNMIHGSIVVFKLYDNIQRKEANYAVVFCENINDIPADALKNVKSDRIIGSVILQYYSTSSSYISCDGEYRTKFCRYDYILSAQKQFPEIWRELDQYIGMIRQKRQWFLSPTYFHGRDNHSDNFEIEKVIRVELISHTMLTLTWFHTIYNELLGLTETHMNNTFKEIFLRESEIDLSFMQELIKKYSPKTIEEFRVNTSHIVHPIFGNKEVRYIPLGFKMIPLNMREIQDPLRLKYKPWKEYLIATKCNDLVVNQIAPGFPITLDWFLIKNTSRGLFDNKSQFERLKHSELARDILHTLYEAQRSTYFATSDLGKAAKSADHIKQWISTKFKRLSDKITDPINYSIEEIIMSNITLAFPSEFVGRTTADTINLIGNSKAYDEQIGKPMTNYDMFAKYIFEICYNLLAINSKLGVMHGDFHLNNSTIGYLYQSDSEAKVVYRLDADHNFVFPNNGYFSCIIDFSRSIINPDEYRNLTDLSLPDTFKPVKDFDKFAANETYNLLNLYLLLFPNKSKQKEEMAVLFKNSYRAIFKLLTCIDLYMYSIRMGIALGQQKYRIDRRCFDLVEKIAKLSEVYIATEVNKLMADESYAKTIESNEWPIATIIKKCFSEYINGTTYKKIGVITDCYSLDNELKYSVSKYELFPESLKGASYYSGDKIIPIEYIVDSRKRKRYNYEQQRLHTLEHLKFIANKMTLE